MYINPQDFSPNSIYHLMTQMVIPRPIAWALTQNTSGSYNLAPFSYFNAVSSAPPLLMLSIGKKPSGEDKDTRRNLKRYKKVVIHIPTVKHMQDVQDSSESFAENESEIEALHLPTTDFHHFSLPRLKQCAIAFGCQLYQHMVLGDQNQEIFFVEVQQIYVNDNIIKFKNEKRISIDPNLLNPLARLGNGIFSKINKLD